MMMMKGASWLVVLISQSRNRVGHAYCATCSHLAAAAAAAADSFAYFIFV